MQIVVPYGSDKGLIKREIRTMSSCLKCKKPSDKPLQLPECCHVFCKRCLGNYFSTLSSWADEPDFFPCPECGVKVKIPDLPSNKWTKAFRAYKEQTTFFTKDSDEVPEQNETETGSDFVQMTSSLIRNNKVTRRVKGSKFYTPNESSDQTRPGETETGSDFVNVRGTCSSNKTRTLHRTAMRLSKHVFEKGFESKISTDDKECLYFGGDVMPGGDIILCDWLNLSVKMFEPSGQFICKIKLDEAPLDVTAVRNDMIVISFGSRSKMVLFLAYSVSGRVLDILGLNKLPGFLYSTTKYDGSCLGIFERDGSKQSSVVHVSIDKTGKRAGSVRNPVIDVITPEKNIELSSESGIFYEHNDRRLYVTSRRRLLCFRKDRRLIFKRNFDKTETEWYYLGAVTCDEKGVIYIASDQCILRVTKDGDLISVVQTPAEPYHLLVRKDQRKLAVVGKQSEIMYYSIEKRT